MNKLVKNIKKDELHSEFLKVLNGILKLPKRELELLSNLCKLQDNPQLSDNEPSDGVISAENRKWIKDNVGITEDNQCRAYRKFKKLGYLVKGKYHRQWVMNPILIPQVIRDRVQISVILKIEDEESTI